jgi:hypothetical protein
VELLASSTQSVLTTPPLHPGVSLQTSIWGSSITTHPLFRKQLRGHKRIMEQPFSCVGNMITYCWDPDEKSMGHWYVYVTLEDILAVLN